MIFEIRKLGQVYDWSIRKGSNENPGAVVARAPQTYGNVTSARASIAAARTALGAARYAKVLVVE